MAFEDLTSYLTHNFFSLVLPLLLGAIIFATIYLTVKLALDRSQRADEIKKVIMIIIRGPVLIITLGYAFVIADRFHPSLFPSYLSIGTLVLIVELLLLLVSINAARKISLIMLKKFFRDRRVSRRMLLIGIYSLGLVVLFYVIFTSPIRSSVQEGALPLVSFISGVVVTYIVAYIVNLIISKYQSAIQETQPQLNTTITFGRRIAVGVIALIGVGATAFASFPNASGAVASVFVAAGFSSIVIGLAAQSSLANLIAGGVISTSQPFRIGDAIIYDSEYCFVEDIRLMYSILRTWDNRRLMVPNAMFLTTVVKNYTAVDESKLSIVYVQITLESDVDKAMEIMKEVIAKNPAYYPADGLPSVQIMGFTEYGVELRALGRAKEQGSNWNLEKESLYEIKKEFDRQGIRIAVPRREIIFGKDTPERGFQDKAAERK